MAKTTFWDIIERTIEKAGIPLSAKEIWDKANELEIIGDFTTTGKTPWNTIAAYCYTDINKNGDTSMIIQTSERPPLFFLRKIKEKIDLEKVQKQEEMMNLIKDNEDTKKFSERDLHKEKIDPEKVRKQKEKMNLIKVEKKFSERDLHPVLVAYAYGDNHFKANLKTIYHENSTKATKGQNEWLHPDIVGVYFPFRDYKPETLEIQNHLSITSIKLFSFELKVTLSFSNLRQSYFQAVSNSSWANEGYLVTLKIDDDPTFKDEIRRLNNAFGIGIIKLNPENVFESDILFPSKINQAIDWDTVNRLANENSDFNEFLKMISDDCKISKVKSQYDNVLKAEDLFRYVSDKGINNK